MKQYLTGYFEVDFQIEKAVYNFQSGLGMQISPAKMMNIC